MDHSSVEVATGVIKGGSGSLLWLMALLPLVGALTTYTVGRVKSDLAGWIAVSASSAAFVCALLSVHDLVTGDYSYLSQSLGTWFSVPNVLTVDFTFRLDRLSAVMILVVTGVGSLIHLYSVGYMHDDPHRPRFFAYLNLFLFFMLTLVLGANLLLLFVGWEGVGLCSYLLIGFWFTNPAYAAAGRKAFVVNRIGDAGFLLGTFILLTQFKTVDFLQLQEAVTLQGPAFLMATVAALSLFVGATGKSAQLPLSVWLPDAMAGPTPVSALIHAATMVTAGVYLTARMHFLFELSPTTLQVIGVVATFTAFIAAATALVQNDIKKVLAYSTVSQLGFMFLAISGGAYWVALFHVVTHAFFKACLFLSAGSVIHACHHEQDMRHMGGLRKMLPWTFLAYAASTVAIAGVFPFAGYFSKHAILEAFHGSSLVSGIPLGEALFMMVEATAFLTAFYMGRSLFLTFFGEYRGHAHPHEGPWMMTLPVVLLGFLAVIGGYVLAGPVSLAEFVAPVLGNSGRHHGHESVVDALINSWVGIAGLLLAAVLYGPLKRIPGTIYRAVGPLGQLLTDKFYIDELYHAVIVGPLERISRILWRVCDQGIIDGMVNGTATFVEMNGEVLRFLQSGQTRYYATLMFGAAVGLIGFLLVY